MQKKLKQIYSECRDNISGHQALFKALLILFIIYLLSISTILRANISYIDDYGRVISGHKGWENFSRYSSWFLSGLIHAGNFLADISPLTQIIGLLFLSAAGIITIYVLGGKQQKVSFWQLAAVFPLGLCPYFLECISYRFDSPYMSLSVLAGVLPLLFAESSIWIFLLASFGGTLLMLTTYQAASGIFPMAVIVYSLNCWVRRKRTGSGQKDILLRIAAAAGGYVLAVLLFLKVIMKPVEAVEGYMSADIAPLRDVLPHLLRYYETVASDFKSWWLVVMGLIWLLYILVSVRESKNNKCLTLLLGIIACVLCGALAFGMYPFLTIPLEAPRAMYGIGALIAFPSVSLVSYRRTAAGKAAAFILTWAFIVVAFAYGNAFSQQLAYTDFRIQEVIEELKGLDTLKTPREEPVKLQVVGGIGKTPVIAGLITNYPVIDSLIPKTFDGSWEWSVWYFMYYYDLRNAAAYYGSDYDDAELEIYSDTIYHTISGNDEYIRIELK